MTYENMRFEIDSHREDAKFVFLTVTYEDGTSESAAGTGGRIRRPLAEAMVAKLNGASEATIRNSRTVRQQRVDDWCAAAFGTDHAASLPQRGIRLLEEAIETAQAAGCERAMCGNLVDYVFSRPKGELRQELGGVGITLLALAAAAGLDADESEASELARVLAKPLAHFAARNKAKNDAGFNVSGASEKPAEGPNEPDCDVSGICCAPYPPRRGMAATICIHCGKELVERDGQWFTWDATENGAQPQGFDHPSGEMEAKSE